MLNGIVKDGRWKVSFINTFSMRTFSNFSIHFSIQHSAFNITKVPRVQSRT